MSAHPTKAMPVLPRAEHVERHTADVAVVGYGPVGALLALQLAQKGHRVLVMDRWHEPYQLPRAVTYDHEIARILSGLGIDSDHDHAVERHPEIYYWKNAEGRTLQEVDWGSDNPSGWATRYWFYQPELEARLRTMAEQHSPVTVLRGCRATELTQDHDAAHLAGVRVDQDGTAHRVEVTASYVVGCDGANSFVRDSQGMASEDHGYFFDWLILDMKPTVERTWSPTHWQLCDPQRPTTIVPGGPGRRRWEFMVLPGEQPSELAAPQRAWQLLEPWDVTPDNAVLERSAVYRFQARWADDWRVGRALIAGDAAHLMPPFAGEGMCAGVRDAVALGWRLDLVLRGAADDALLDSYGTERREHVKYYVNFSMELGRVICITDPQAAAERDERMLAEMADYDGTPVNTDIGVLGPGIGVAGDAHVGELAHQGRVTANGTTARFDDAVGRGWTLLGWRHDPREQLEAHQLRALDALGANLVSVGPEGSGCAVEDTDGVFEQWLAGMGVDYVLIRPDYYVAATASDPAHLRRSVATVLDRLHLTREFVAAHGAAPGPDATPPGA